LAFLNYLNEEVRANSTDTTSLIQRLSKLKIDKADPELEAMKDRILVSVEKNKAKS